MNSGSGRLSISDSTFVPFCMVKKVRPTQEKESPRYVTTAAEPYCTVSSRSCADTASWRDGASGRASRSANRGKRDATRAIAV